MAASRIAQTRSDLRNMADPPPRVTRVRELTSLIVYCRVSCFDVKLTRRQNVQQNQFLDSVIATAARKLQELGLPHEFFDCAGPPRMTSEPIQSIIEHIYAIPYEKDIDWPGEVGAEDPTVGIITIIPPKANRFLGENLNAGSTRSSNTQANGESDKLDEVRLRGSCDYYVSEALTRVNCDDDIG